ncbi:hypothetical protein [Rhodopirellula europaea]|uniref:hypothetical protein n=1 Tax=Rhodopirellula europaea TaxID=1263866 RepID=UPI003D28CD90
MTAYSFKFHRVIATVVIGFTFSAVTAQDTFGQSLPQPVTLAAPEMGNMSDMLQSSSTPEMSDAIAPDQSQRHRTAGKRYQPQRYPAIVDGWAFRLRTTCHVRQRVQSTSNDRLHRPGLLWLHQTNLLRHQPV